MKSAAVAAGMVHELRFGRSNTRETHDNLSLAASSHYIFALQLLRRELAQDHQRIPMAMTCFLLAFVELLVNRPRGALTHLRGAVKIFRGNQNVAEDVPSRQISLETEQLESLFKVSNLQNLLYSMSCEHDWTGNTLLPQSLTFSDLWSARTLLFSIMQESLQWCTENFRLKYFPYRQPRELLTEQGRHLAALSMWLERFSIYIMPYEQRDTQKCRQTTLESRELALRLRMICMSTIIHVSHILDPEQTSYDSQEPRFQQIVADGQDILRVRSEKGSPNHEVLPPMLFSMEPGIIQPLFLTASNCRSGTLRRNAIACLLDAGQEGPWVGRREAALSLRIVQHEEAWPKAPSSWSGLESEWRLDRGKQCSLDPVASHAICEEARLISCIMLPENCEWNMNSVPASFIRCDNLRTMLALAEGFNGVFEELFSPEFSCRSWEETLSYQGGECPK